jgi:hydrogenase maturation protease
MTPVRIIGLGSPHGADAAGWRAIEALRQGGLAARFPPGTVSLENCPAPVHLYRLVEGCRVAVLIDAVASDAGQAFDIEPELLRREPARYSAHAIGVADMLELLDTLANPPPRVLLLGLPVGAAGDESAPLQALLPALSRRVERTIDRYLEGAA